MNRFEGLVNAVKDNSNSPAVHRQWVQYFASIKGFPSFSAFTDIISVFFHDEGLRANHSDIIHRNIAKAVTQFGADRVKAFLVPFLRNIDPAEDCSNFFILLHYKAKENNANPLVGHKEILAICHHRLRLYTEKFSDVPTAFGLLYLCWEEVRESRITLTRESLKIIRNYIGRYPEDYLRFIVRSRYTPPGSMSPNRAFEFVFEPFTVDIFGSWEEFISYLHDLKARQKVNSRLLGTISRYFDLYKMNDYQAVTLHSADLEKFSDLPAVAEVIQSLKSRESI